MTPAGERHKAPQHHRFQESDRTATGWSGAGDAGPWPGR